MLMSPISIDNTSPVIMEFVNNVPSWWLRWQFQTGIIDEKYFYGMLEKGAAYWGEETIRQQKERRKLKIECECCHRLIPMPYFTPQAMAEANITVVRTRGGRIIYYCHNGCRRRHRGRLAGKGIEFWPEDLIHLLKANKHE